MEPQDDKGATFQWEPATNIRETSGPSLITRTTRTIDWTIKRAINRPVQIEVIKFIIPNGAGALESARGVRILHQMMREKLKKKVLR